MTPITLPDDYPRIRRVTSFDELITSRFDQGVNAFVWERSLPGDFAEVVERLAVGPGITPLSEARLRSLPVSAAGRTAIDVMLEDLRLLGELDLDPVLESIHGYLDGESTGPLRTDVCSFHIDSATIETDTWLCAYHGAPSEGLRNDEAIRHVDVPATRAALREHYGGADDEGFLEYLGDHFYDLHYAPVPAARPFSFGLGNLWRIAVAYPGSPVPPFIHRAPDPLSNQEIRLLLIS